MRKCYLGIDPGKITGLAVVDSDRNLLFAHSIQFPFFPTFEVGRTKHLAGAPIVAACIESQYVGSNIGTTIVLAQMAGRWIEACESQYISTSVISPSEWQGELLDLSHRAKSTERKQAAIDMCSNLWHTTLDEHSADAALIALWLVGSQRC